MAIIKNTYDTVKQAFQDLIAPQLAEIKGEINGSRIEMRTEIRRLDEKIDSLRAELSLTRQHLDEKVSMLSRRLDEALEVRERLAALEAKLAAH